MLWVLSFVLSVFFCLLGGGYFLFIFQIKKQFCKWHKLADNLNLTFTAAISSNLLRRNKHFLFISLACNSTTIQLD